MACCTNLPAPGDIKCKPHTQREIEIEGLVVKCERVGIPDKPSDHDLGWINIWVDVSGDAEHSIEPLKITFRYEKKMWDNIIEAHGKGVKVRVITVN